MERRQSDNVLQTAGQNSLYIASNQRDDRLVRVVYSGKKYISSKRRIYNYNFEWFDKNAPEGHQSKIWLNLSGSMYNYTISEHQGQSSVPILHCHVSDISGPWASNIVMRVRFSRFVPVIQLEFADGTQCKLRRLNGRGLNVEYEVLHVTQAPVASEKAIGTVSLVTPTCCCGNSKVDASLRSEVRLYGRDQNFAPQMIPLFFIMMRTQTNYRQMLANVFCLIPGLVIWILTQLINSQSLMFSILALSISLFTIILRMIVLIYGY
ncbi:hypothetical protein MP228_001997 [Amoeboaphelidium protococcarum]|nr:hypothetical protein MP228_001997 [Amoeboaphelidium protococcarum]